jgi:hypothetical protein
MDAEMDAAIARYFDGKAYSDLSCSVLVFMGSDIL